MYTPGLDTSPMTNILIGFKVVDPRLTSKKCRSRANTGGQTRITLFDRFS